MIRLLGTHILSFPCRRILNTLQIYAVCRIFRDRIKSMKMSQFSQSVNSLSEDLEWDTQDDCYDYHREIARSAFADMLHDSERNNKYYGGLKAAIEKFHSRGMPANVLDIGTGTGLLAMMAVKCGADSVTACEAFKPMADCALRVIDDNHLAEKITLIPKRSTNLVVGSEGDMKTRANILVTEVFDTELIGEGALETFAHAHKELLERDCIVVPQSATIYAQIVECPALFKWNRVMDVANENGDILLKTPTEVVECPGGAYIHDLQLNQLPKYSFREILKPIPVLKFDWSGNSPISKKNLTLNSKKCMNTGQAQMVFMWWDIEMDTEGKITLSCAPWWAHPDAKISKSEPSESIPWRDHWMQGVYYLPKEVSVKKDEEICLASAHDEFSLWFYLKEENRKTKTDSMPPTCTCGMHFMLSRTHISYLNDGKRNKKFFNALQKVNKESTLLCLNGASLIGLSLAKIAKKVYYVEPNKFIQGILKSYIKFNGLRETVEMIDKIGDCPLEDISQIFVDPNFSSAILPWHNLQFISSLNNIKNRLNEYVNIIPNSFTIWIVPLEFNNLHKIRIPLEECEGFLMQKFDALIEGSRSISDYEIESQPLWEYPGYCRAKPKEIVKIAVKDASGKISSVGSITFQQPQKINGCALWMTWILDGNQTISTGPIVEPEIGEKVLWDSHTRQGVQLFKAPKLVNIGDSINYQFSCDFEKGLCNISINFNKSV